MKEREKLNDRFTMNQFIIEESDYDFLFNFDTFKETILNNKDKQLKYIDVGKMWDVDWVLAEQIDNCYYVLSERINSNAITKKILELYPYSEEELLEMKIERENCLIKYFSDKVAPGKYKGKSWFEVKDIDEQYIEWMISKTKDHRFKKMLQYLLQFEEKIN